MAAEPGNEYLTVTEFAKMAGVSRQAVQQRMETSLAEFVKANEQGKKTIHRNGLQLFGVDFGKPKAQDTEGKSKANEQGSKAKTQGENTDSLYAALLQTVETLQAQLAIKDKQIEGLLNALESAQQSAARAQTLHAGEIQRELLEAHTEPPEAPQSAPEQPREAARKRGFFSRWKRG